MGFLSISTFEVLFESLDLSTYIKNTIQKHVLKIMCSTYLPLLEDKYEVIPFFTHEHYLKHIFLYK